MKNAGKIGGLLMVILLTGTGCLSGVLFANEATQAPPPAESLDPGTAAVDPTSPSLDPTPTITIIEMVEEGQEREEEMDPAPDFSLENLTGDTISLSDYRGKAVMINFWATWCPPCRAEMPLIQDFANQYADELVVLAINAGEHRADVAYFVEEHEFDLVFLLDPENSVATLFNVRGFPTTLFIDKQGVLQGTFIGEMDEAILSTYLQEIGLGE